MNDGLAEKLFDAFWAGVCAHGWPKPMAWSELHQTQRDAWEQVAIAAREDFARCLNVELEMLRGANEAWQRENATLRAGIEQQADSFRVQLRGSLQNFSDVLTSALASPPVVANAMLRDLCEQLKRIAEGPN